MPVTLKSYIAAQTEKSARELEKFQIRIGKSVREQASLVEFSQTACTAIPAPGLRVRLDGRIGRALIGVMECVTAIPRR